MIGKGGMGNVYLAEHTQLGRKVAIKMLHPKLTDSDALKSRFKSEASTLAHLQHPNIVTLFDYVENEDGLFLIMEYVDGMDLSDHINTVSGPIPNEQAVKIFSQVLDGFAYAHEKGVVHRDIKPSNILLTAEGDVKIMDFGIAKILDDDKSLTKTGTQLGTVLYMSPEQVRGEKVDKVSDIYSLGVTLFQMVTGRCAYDQNSSEYMVYNQIVNEPLPKASTIYPAVSSHLEGIIQKATEKNRTDRYSTCKEFKAALNSRASMQTKVASKEDQHSDAVVDSTKPIKPRAVKEPTPESKENPKNEEVSKKKKWLWPVLIASVAILTVIAIFFTFFNGDQDPWANPNVLKYVFAGSAELTEGPGDDRKLRSIAFGKELQLTPKSEITIDNSVYREAIYEGITGWVKTRIGSNHLIVDFSVLDKLNKAIRGRNHQDIMEDIPAYGKHAILEFWKEKNGAFEVFVDGGDGYPEIAFFRSRIGNRKSSSDRKKGINDGKKDMMFVTQYPDRKQSVVYMRFNDDYERTFSEEIWLDPEATGCKGLERTKRRTKLKLVGPGGNRMDEKLAFDAMYVVVEGGQSFYYYGPENRMQQFYEAIPSNWKSVQDLQDELEYGSGADCMCSFTEPFLDFRFVGNYVLYSHDYHYWTVYYTHSVYDPSKYRQTFELLDRNGEIIENLEIINEPADDGMSEEIYPRTCIRADRYGGLQGVAY